MSRPDLNPWTPQQIATLRRLREQNYSLARIAARVGHSANACKTKVHKLGLYKSAPRAVVAAAGQNKNMRPCLCCRAPFRSEGPHNRMCPKCRTVSVSPFEP